MFLNPKGRQVLVNSVVDSAISYLMAAILLPAETIESLDQKRRAFEGPYRSKLMLAAETSP